MEKLITNPSWSETLRTISELKESSDHKASIKEFRSIR